MNDKNDILQMLRDREGEFHLPLRRDGWEKLEAELPALLPEQDASAVTMKPVRRRLYRRTAAVAAVALLCLMISVVVFRREEPQTVVAERPVVTPSTKEENTVPALPQEEIPEKPAQARFFPYIQIIDSLMPELSPVDLPAMEVLVAESAEDSAGQAETPRPVHKDSGPQPERRNGIPYRHVEEKKKVFDFNRVAFGIQTGSNNVTNMGGGLEHYDDLVSDPGPRPNPDDKPEKRLSAVAAARVTIRRIIITGITCRLRSGFPHAHTSRPGSRWKQACLIRICIRKSWKRRRLMTAPRSCIISVCR